MQNSQSDPFEPGMAAGANAGAGAEINLACFGVAGQCYAREVA